MSLQFIIISETAEKPIELPPAEEIVQKWLSTRKSVSGGNEAIEECVTTKNSDIPEALKMFEPLPPSLIPPPSGGWCYSCGDLAEWG